MVIEPGRVILSPEEVKQGRAEAKRRGVPDGLVFREMASFEMRVAERRKRLFWYNIAAEQLG